MDKPLCNICKTVLVAGTQGDMVCPNCAAVYYPDREIVQYQDDFTSSHEDEMPELSGAGGGAGIMAATDEVDGPLTDQLYKSWRHKPSQGENAERWD